MDVTVGEWSSNFERTATGWKEHTLHAFTGGNAGAYPFFVKLVFDTAGNIYGTTEAGGTYGNGVAFELVPRIGGGWREKVLHNFGKSQTPDGANPYAGVVLDPAGMSTAQRSMAALATERYLKSSPEHVLVGVCVAKPMLSKRVTFCGLPLYTLSPI